MSDVGPVNPFNGIIRRPLMPVSGGTVNGEKITVPRGAETMTIHVPALVGVGATVKLQSLSPDIAEDGTETWADISVFKESDGTFTVVDGLVESTTVTLYKTAFGSGIIRFVASEDQSSAPVRIPVVFGF